MATTYTSVLEWDDGQELRITRYDSWLGRRLVYFFSWDAMYATDDLNVSVGTLRPFAAGYDTPENRGRAVNVLAKI